MFIFDSMPVRPMRITSHYGPRNTGIKGASTYHKGIDLGRNWTLMETPIYAVKDGKVVKNEYIGTRGHTIIIEHNSRYSTLYQHLKARPPLEVGTKINAGQVVGIMGRSSSTLDIAEHLHFELWDNGKPIDPEQFLKGDILFLMTENELRRMIREELLHILRGEGSTPSEWGATIWEEATLKNITDGDRPQGYATREQVAAMIYRALGVE